MGSRAGEYTIHAAISSAVFRHSIPAERGPPAAVFAAHPRKADWADASAAGRFSSAATRLNCPACRTAS
jgi:hypothetical protein